MKMLMGGGRRAKTRNWRKAGHGYKGSAWRGEHGMPSAKHRSGKRSSRRSHR